MPYVIVEVKDGFKVRKKFRDKDGKFKYFSKHGLTYEQAVKQRTAIILSELLRGRKK